VFAFWRFVVLLRLCCRRLVLLLAPWQSFALAMRERQTAGWLASAYGFAKKCRVGVLGLQPHFVCLPLPALATPQIFVNNEAEASLCPLAQAQKPFTKLTS